MRQLITGVLLPFACGPDVRRHRFFAVFRFFNVFARRRSLGGPPVCPQAGQRKIKPPFGSSLSISTTGRLHFWQTRPVRMWGRCKSSDANGP
jgi:hypothetical protein